MTNQHKIVFVGQGPNQTSWEDGLALGARFVKVGQRAGGKVPTAEELVDEIQQWAKRRAALLALTGAAGKRIGGLLDLDAGEFMRKFHRRNLNARWNGKAGKGDKFDRAEAKVRAAEILDEGFDRIVCVGGEVAAAFGIGKVEPLAEVGRYIPAPGGGERYVTFFLLPHPSGIVQWWNDQFNCFRARKRLREFLEIPTNAQ